MRTCTTVKRILRGIRFSIALKEESYAFLVWSVRVESWHNHDLPWQIPYKAGRTENWLAQSVEAFDCELKCCFWSPTCVCNTHTCTHKIIWKTWCSSHQYVIFQKSCNIGSDKKKKTNPDPERHWTPQQLKFQYFHFEKHYNNIQENRALEDAFCLYTVFLNNSLALEFATTQVSSKTVGTARQRHQMLYNINHSPLTLLVV